MAIKEILLLGNPKLYEVSETVQESELNDLALVIKDLHDTMIDFRNKYGVGRAIAAPQIGIFKRLLYMYIDEPVVFINPTLEFIDDEMMEIIDDCMSFPQLLVRVKRYKRCTIEYLDLQWEPRKIMLEGDLSELLQHEYDHLDGILATMRAIDNKSFYLRSEIFS
ncbi:N-formylmethionyl-tRNA deformylase [Desulfosporosinus acidiphilus SJ4]|uniref:Peptide deformylase n=1 Tax=Desulfosporosinus acidiphilus (strain DSM 22704 / JCM 16185 / SJ4) TaxID=646529 RepID=I4D6I3_DESAJ|nr:peptide deformylase [Desulfosporosinus acidiphilus]AFM41407.1 N-formylmethionyl-tRNA deformylase [Desulfosporosinus acidiphilus SJ4]